MITHQQSSTWQILHFSDKLAVMGYVLSWSLHSRFSERKTVAVSLTLWAGMYRLDPTCQPISCVATTPATLQPFSINCHPSSYFPPSPLYKLCISYKPISIKIFLNIQKQCCGSRSVCFWAFWIWIRIHQQVLRMDPDPSIIKQKQ